jgi:hypothetical protein
MVADALRWQLQHIAALPMSVMKKLCGVLKRPVLADLRPIVGPEPDIQTEESRTMADSGPLPLHVLGLLKLPLNKRIDCMQHAPAWGAIDVPFVTKVHQHAMKRQLAVHRRGGETWIKRDHFRKSF